jgi:hypothetical protein
MARTHARDPRYVGCRVQGRAEKKRHASLPFHEGSNPIHRLVALAHRLYPYRVFDSINKQCNKVVLRTAWGWLEARVVRGSRLSMSIPAAMPTKLQDQLGPLLIAKTPPPTSLDKGARLMRSLERQASFLLARWSKHELRTRTRTWSMPAPILRINPKDWDAARQGTGTKKPGQKSIVKLDTAHGAGML